MRHVTGNNGVTLIELLVVAAIIGILALALAFSYQGWIGNYRIENQTKQLYADLMEARTRALTRNVTCLASVTSGGYKVVEDSDNSGKIDAADTCLWGGSPCQPKTIESKYQYKLFSAGSFPSDMLPLLIDTRGLLSLGGAPVGTIDVGIDTLPEQPTCCRPTNTCGALDSANCRNPDYDCIIITQDRIRMGKWNGGASCAEK